MDALLNYNLEGLTMKKIYCNIKSLATLLVVGAAFTACSSSENDIENGQPEQPASKKYTLTIEASKEDIAGSTRALYFVDDELVASWALGESVEVRKFTSETETEQIGIIQPLFAGKVTTLNGVLDRGYVEVGDKLELNYNYEGSYDSQDGALDYLMNNYDKATAVVTVEGIIDGKIQTDKSAVFVNKQAIVKITLQNTTANKNHKLTVTTPKNTIVVGPESADDYSEVYVAIPEFSGALNLSCDGKSFSKDVTIQNGKYYTLTANMK